MKHNNKWMGRSKAAGLAILGTLLMAPLAHAESLGDLSVTWGTQANQGQTFAVLAAGFVGFAMVVYGIYKGTYGAKDDQQVKPMQMFGIALAGALMVAAVTMTDVFQDTFGIDGAAETGGLDAYNDARP